LFRLLRSGICGIFVRFNVIESRGLLALPELRVVVLISDREKRLIVKTDSIDKLSKISGFNDQGVQHWGVLPISKSSFEN